MKRLTKLLIIVVITSVFCVTSVAKEPDEYINEFEEILPDEVEERLDLGDGGVSLLGPDALLSEILSILQSRQGEIVSFLLVVFGAALLISLSSSLWGELSGAVSAGVGALCTTLIFAKIGSIFSEVAGSLSRLSEFFSAAVPIMTAVSAASGSASTALVQNSGMTFTLFLLGGVGNSFFISVVGLGLAMSLLVSFGDEVSLSVTKGIKSFFIFCVGAASSVLGAVFALQTVVASAADGAAIRAARYAASGLIPVVGSAVSGALSTIVSGLAYAKSIIGVGGITVIALLSLSPLIMLLLYRFCIALVLAFCNFCGQGGATKMLSAFKFSMDSMIALYTVSVLVYIIEIVMFMKGGAMLS